MAADGALPVEATNRWQIVAELPYVDLQPAYEEVRKLRHVLYKPFDAVVDDQISFAYRGYEFRIARRDAHMDILVNDPNCPTDVLLEPLTQLINRLSRCTIKRD